LYSILICIVLDAPWSYIVCCFRSFQFEEEEEEEQEVPSTTVANIHQQQARPKSPIFEFPSYTDYGIILFVEESWSHGFEGFYFVYKR